MNFKIETGYRLNVAMIVLNEEKRVYFVKEEILKIGNFLKGE